MSLQTVNVTATGAQTAFTKLGSIKSFMVQLSGTFTTLAFTFEASLDGTNFDPVPAIGISGDGSVVGPGTTISPSNSTGYLWRVLSDGMPYVRLNVSSIASGTAVVKGEESDVGVLTTTIQQNNTISANQAYTGTIAGTSAGANALAVGRLGTTTPAFNVDASAATSITGLNVAAGASGAGVSLAAIGEANVAFNIDAKGSGALVLQGTGTGAIKHGAAAVPNANDGVALGSAALQWSDLFLAEGGVINFDNGDITITQTSGVLAFAGTTSVTFDGQVNPATNDAASLGTTALGWSDLFFATGAVINFANGEVTITETDANTLTCAGLSAFSFGAGVTLNATGTRIVQSYHTNLTSTNAVTVDSSETVKRDISPYRQDALAAICKMDVITFRHQDHLADDRLKLGLRAESVGEPLAVDRIERAEGGSYPGVNLYGLAAIQTRALQQLAEKVERLEKAAA